MKSLKQWFSDLMQETTVYRETLELKENLEQKEKALQEEMAKLHQENEKILASFEKVLTAVEQRGALSDEAFSGKLAAEAQQLKEILQEQKTAITDTVCQNSASLQNVFKDRVETLAGQTAALPELLTKRFDALELALSTGETRIKEAFQQGTITVTGELASLNRELSAVSSDVQKTVNDRADQLDAHVRNQTEIVAEALNTVSGAVQKTVNDRADQLGAHVRNQTELVTETLNTVSSAVQKTVNDRADQLESCVQNQTGIVTEALNTVRSTVQKTVNERVDQLDVRVQNQTGIVTETLNTVSSSVQKTVNDRADQLGAHVQDQTGVVTGALAAVSSDVQKTVNDRVDQLGAHVQNQTGVVTGALAAVSSDVQKTMNDRVDQLGAHVQNQTGVVTGALAAVSSDVQKTVNERVDQLGAHVQSQTGIVTEALSAVGGAVQKTVNDRSDQLDDHVQNQTEIITAANDARQQAQKDELAAFRQELTETVKQNGRLDKEEIALLFKHGIEGRWQILDALDHLLYPADFPVTCTVCHHTDRKDSYRTCVTHCCFNGGRLERFICPVCGAIFGPLKMLTLDQEQLAAEYRQGYHTFSESDTTFLELDVFQELAPTREGIYLNFGAGAWNKTTVQLREEGFQVYDYEPYAPAQKNPWVFTTLEEASQFKYNGIFSNDLIEHLRTPATDLQKMISMMTDDGVMVHGSGCYDYAFEYTRFHLTFFTGNSLEYLCKETGLGFELGEHVYSYSPFRKCKFFRTTE